jgi:hypothetical protein
MFQPKVCKLGGGALVAPLTDLGRTKFITEKENFAIFFYGELQLIYNSRGFCALFNLPVYYIFVRKFVYILCFKIFFFQH